MAHWYQYGSCIKEHFYLENNYQSLISYYDNPFWNFLLQIQIIVYIVSSHLLRSSFSNQFCFWWQFITFSPFLYYAHFSNYGFIFVVFVGLLIRKEWRAWYIYRQQLQSFYLHSHGKQSMHTVSLSFVEVIPEHIRD